MRKKSFIRRLPESIRMTLLVLVIIFSIPIIGAGVILDSAKGRVSNYRGK